MAGMTEDTKAEAIRIGQPVGTNEVLARSFYPDPFYLTEMIYETATDNFVGFSRNWLNGGDAEHLITCFHPDQRGKGYMHRFLLCLQKLGFYILEEQVLHTIHHKDRLAITLQIQI